MQILHITTGEYITGFKLNLPYHTSYNNGSKYYYVAKNRIEKSFEDLKFFCRHDLIKAVWVKKDEIEGPFNEDEFELVDD